MESLSDQMLQCKQIYIVKELCKVFTDRCIHNNAIHNIRKYISDKFFQSNINYVTFLLWILILKFNLAVFVLALKCCCQILQ